MWGVTFCYIFQKPGRQISLLTSHFSHPTSHFYYINIDTILNASQVIPENTPENIGASTLESKPVIQSIKNAI